MRNSGSVSIMSLFSKTKDWIIEKAALHYVNTKLLAPYGQATTLHIDSTARNATIDVELKGETLPVRVELIGFEITQEGDRYFATAGEIRTSREWLTELARAQIGNSRFEIPADVGRKLKLAL
jgi:hypothetical protein